MGLTPGLILISAKREALLESGLKKRNRKATNLKKIVYIWFTLAC